MEVHASQGTYAVSFEGTAGQQLSTFADSAMATLDTVPASRTNGPGEALTWLLRACFAAAAIAIAMVWLGRRKGRGTHARDLWPP